MLVRIVPLSSNVFNSCHSSSTLSTILTVVDSLKPTEIVVSLSAICHWNDPVPSIPLKDEGKPPSKNSGIPPENTSGTEHLAQGSFQYFIITS